jgi:2-polyprenyl-3-methyl-5-hydroxy-6-metoxy-1,4-benzoquinol methylase|tara:strand:- start:45 stop:1346 length:1302 start_codon:yes stop_codon:yes gene_type:complete
MTVTLVMLSWKRISNLIAAIEAEFDGTLVSEVIVWNNNPEEDLTGRLPENVRLIQTSEDFGMRTRFGAALFAHNDCILLHDDDLIIPTTSIQTLYNHWKDTPEIMHGIFGRIPKHDNTYASPIRDGVCEMVVGRCMMLHRQYCADFFTMEREMPAREDHSALHGQEDILMSYYVADKAGRHNKVHRVPIEELLSNESICERPGHDEQRTEFMHKCQVKFEDAEVQVSEEMSELSQDYWDAQAIAEVGYSKVMNRGWQSAHQLKMHNEQVVAIAELQVISGNSVLDIGCGSGRLAKELLHLGATSLHGLDISPEMLSFAQDECKEFNNATWEPRDLKQGLSQKDGAFDIAFEWSVLLHILEDENFEFILREMARVASKYVILGMDGPDTIQETSYFKRRTRAHHIQTLEDAGCTLISQMDVNGGHLTLALFEKR